MGNPMERAMRRNVTLAITQRRIAGARYSIRPPGARPKFLASRARPASINGSSFMRILDRYISQQVLTTALFAIGVLSIVLVLGNIFKQLLDVMVNQDVPLHYIISFIEFIVPFSLTFTIPWGFLTAVLLIFGRLSAENELIALRSNGVSVPRICVPVFILSLICVAICFWINIDIAPRAQEQVKTALMQIATSNPIAVFNSDQVIDEFPGKLIYVEKKDGPQLSNILVYDMNDHGQLAMCVHARTGEILPDISGKQEIILRLNDAQYEERDADKPEDLTLIHPGIGAARNDFAISLEELYLRHKKERGPSQEDLPELLKQMADSTLDAQTSTTIKTEINKRFSFSLASFAFCLIAVPLAITAHRKETSIGFLFSLAVAFVYFFIIIMVDTVHSNPKFHPEILIWMPNVIFISLGAYLFFRMSRR